MSFKLASLCAQGWDKQQTCGLNNSGLGLLITRRRPHLEHACHKQPACRPRPSPFASRSQHQSPPSRGPLPLDRLAETDLVMTPPDHDDPPVSRRPTNPKGCERGGLGCTHASAVGTRGGHWPRQPEAKCLSCLARERGAPWGVTVVTMLRRGTEGGGPVQHLPAPLGCRCRCKCRALRNEAGSCTLSPFQRARRQQRPDRHGPGPATWHTPVGSWQPAPKTSQQHWFS